MDAAPSFRLEVKLHSIVDCEDDEEQPAEKARTQRPLNPRQTLPIFRGQICLRA